MEFEINNDMNEDFNFKLPSKKFNLMDDSVLFNKAKISDDVISMSSDNNSNDSESDENGFTLNKDNSENNSDDFSEISSDDVTIKKNKPINNIQNEITEKKEILYQFDRLKSKGVKIPYDYNLNSNIHEMRSSYERITREKEIDSAVRFQRKMLMGFVTGCEFLNTQYNPFHVELDGWSEQVHESVDDYDDIFEELHDKYKSTGSNMAPELRLLVSLGGSAFMFHLTKKMFSNTELPKVEEVLNNNPALMKQFQEAAAMEYMKGKTDNRPPPVQSKGLNNLMGTNLMGDNGGGDIFGMVSSLFNNNNNNNMNNDIDNIINNVHSKINIDPQMDDMMETLTVTEDELTSLLEDTADIKIINNVTKKKKTKKDTRVLAL